MRSHNRYQGRLPFQIVPADARVVVVDGLRIRVSEERVEGPSGVHYEVHLRTLGFHGEQASFDAHTPEEIKERLAVALPAFAATCRMRWPQG
jgi:hypothetical protein